MAKYKGFTLIETLIVVLIIGTLATVALPMFHGLIVKAKLQQLFLDVEQICKSIELHISENGWVAFDETEYDIPSGGDNFRYIIRSRLTGGPALTYFYYVAVITRKDDAELCRVHIEEQADSSSRRIWRVIENDRNPWSKYLAEMITASGESYTYYIPWVAP